MTALDIINELDQPNGVSHERFEDLMTAAQRLPDFGTPIFVFVLTETVNGAFIYFLGEDDANDLRSRYNGGRA